MCIVEGAGLPQDFIDGYSCISMVLHQEHHDTVNLMKQGKNPSPEKH